MTLSTHLSLHCTLIVFLIFSPYLYRPTYVSGKSSYIVYLGAHSHGLNVSTYNSDRAMESHYELLGSFLGIEKAKKSIFYSYTKHINGFAATLDEKVAAEIAKHPKVVSVFENKGRKLLTTRSWDFLGLEKNGVIHSRSAWKKARFGEDTIIGNLDGGVWPESQSFSDDGFGPIPSKWKGSCQDSQDLKFRCNRKLIGARYFNKGYESIVGALNFSDNTPRDMDGHGTHTLSTAGGNFVPGANVLGYGNGTAKGGSPRARVAAYKVCYFFENDSDCYDADILAAFDMAINDGVDVLSVSLGSGPSPFDSVAIGSLHAVIHGIVVVCSAGNSGPKTGTVSNIALWQITVGASTMDRQFSSQVVLGNKMWFAGKSLSTETLAKKTYFPIISASNAKAANASETDASLCIHGTLEPTKVRGKILVCIRGNSPRVEKGQQAALVGAVGMVLVNDVSSGNEINADAHVLPASHINFDDGVALFDYLNNTNSPLAYITRPITELGIKPAPFMAAFSSQGPNTITPEILKPDITAPGVSVIAAYTGAAGPTNLDFDKRRVLFNSDSGTSMSCPHIAGVVGLLKTLYPSWSPAAIKSAIMTTACIQDNLSEPMKNASLITATPFSYGSGHVQPNRAMDPGLVYDLRPRNYLRYLCSLGYNETHIAQFALGPFKCPGPIHLSNINYPSITVPNLNGSMTVTRTVKNVGPPGTYTVTIQEPAGIYIAVKPDYLTFNKIGEEKRFKIELKVKNGNKNKDYVFGHMLWSDGKRYVRSPIVVKAIVN